MDARILVVEDEPAILSLVSAALGQKGIPCTTANSVAMAREKLARGPVDIILTDVYLPDGSGLSLVTHGPSAPLAIVMTGAGDVKTAVAAMRGGAIDYITKPFSVAQLLQSVGRAIEEWRDRGRTIQHARMLETLVVLKSDELSRTSRQVDEVHDATVAALGAALNLKDHDTADHCVRVSRNSVTLGTRLGLSAPDLRNLRWGAFLHDIGKIGVPESILLKPAALTEEEKRIVRKHPQMGYDMLRSIEFLSHATDVVLRHHEWFDGRGYPGNLAGTAIPLHARIFALMDALDAMTADRPYRRPSTFAEAAAEIERSAGTHLDPDIVREFLRAPAEEWLLLQRP